MNRPQRHRPKQDTSQRKSPPPSKADHWRYGWRWQQARRRYLSQPENALCRHCQKENHITAANTINHIIPWRNGKTEEEKDALFWDEENWEPLCKSHHDRITAKEHGGFGREPKKRTGP